ncbi:MAG: type I phosphomannose isomerase catalytic subunit [Bacilli bacterium]|jgi:mannose-6-phosphate isomerase
MSSPNKKINLLKLEPLFVERIWGGTWLKEEYGYKIDKPNIGECWAISAHPSGDCKIASGYYHGWTLSQIYEQRRDLFADDSHNKFPLMVKLIDAKDDLSIQVHPDDRYARLHEGQSGKSEAWIILHTLPNARIQIGHTAMTRDELCELVKAGKWDQLLKYRPLKEGEVFDIKSGTLHAICKGTSLIEIQQSSDLTYRVYDYDRVDHNGLKRPLHIDKALDVIAIPQQDKPIRYLPLNRKKNILFNVLSNDYFAIQALDVDGKYTFVNRDRNYFLVTILEGQGKIGGRQFKKGESIILTSRFSRMTFQGKMRLVLANPKKF